MSRVLAKTRYDFSTIQGVIFGTNLFALIFFVVSLVTLEQYGAPSALSNIALNLSNSSIATQLFVYAAATLLGGIINLSPPCASASEIRLRLSAEPVGFGRPIREYAKICAKIWLRTFLCLICATLDFYSTRGMEKQFPCYAMTFLCFLTRWLGFLILVPIHSDVLNVAVAGSANTNM